MPGCLYRLTFPNGKAYIGITRHGLPWRLKRHRMSIASGVDTILYRAWKKYGEDQIKKEVLVVASDIGYLRDLEVAAIRAYGVKSPGGYNMTAGGDGTVDPCHEMIQRRKEIAADPAWIARMVEKQRALWTDDMRADRGEQIKTLWEGEYGDRLRAKYAASRKPRVEDTRTPEEKAAHRLAVFTSPETRAKQRAAMARPETRAKMSEAGKRAQALRRDETAAIQTELMSDVENCLRIARTLSPLGDKKFQKVKKPVRGDFLIKLWDQIPEISTFDDLFRLGFRKNALPRALRNKNLKIVDEADQSESNRNPEAAAA